MKDLDGQDTGAGRKAEIDRKIRAAEEALAGKDSPARGSSAVRSAAIARKLQRAETPDRTTAAQTPINERRLLEKIEHENRRKAGGPLYREILTRVGLGEVDNATLLLFAFTCLTMLLIPLTFIVTS
ncbi:MAG: hypothetical protein AAGD13_19925 [Pseudomonadota bacterium]